MNKEERTYYNALAISTDASYAKLTKYADTKKSWYELWQTYGLKNTHDPQELYKKMENAGVELILKTDPDYPNQLKEIPHPPHALYIRGNRTAIKNTQTTTTVAIVGTRKATGSATQCAKEYAKILAEEGVLVVSGLAFGIDAAAHHGTLTGGGTTIAVLATGADTVYPKNHHHLAQEIIAGGGAIVSEYPCDTQTLPYRFLERNRIVSGLSRATLIIEAPLASGSLATARFALDQNRDVLVIPGPITHPNYHGSHELIRSGASLIGNVENLLEELGITQEKETLSTEKEIKNKSYDTLEESQIVNALSHADTPLSLDKICEMTKISIQVAAGALTTLILSNAIHETESGYAIKNTRHR